MFFRFLYYRLEEFLIRVCVCVISGSSTENVLPFKVFAFITCLPFSALSFIITTLALCSLYSEWWPGCVRGGGYLAISNSLLGLSANALGFRFILHPSLQFPRLAEVLHNRVFPPPSKDTKLLLPPNY